MSWALAWLTGTAWGRGVAAGAITLAVVALVLWRARQAGYAARLAEEAITALEGARERIRSDEDLRRLDRRARTDALRRWVREPAGE
jgi:hypothetical protein